MRTVLLALLTFAMPLAASAQDGRPTDRLRNALDAMPVEAVQMSMPFLAAFADPAMAGDSSGLSLRATASMIGPLAALSTLSAEEWAELAGFPAEDIGTFLTFGQPPNEVTLWGELPAQSPDMLKAKLERLGFAPEPDVPDTFANGVPMRNDLARASATDPWRGPVGRPSVISFDDDRIVQTASLESQQAIRASTAGVAELPFVAIALAGLDKTIGGMKVGGSILQAVLISPSVGLSSPIPDVLFTKNPRDINDTVAALRDSIEKPQPGIPLYIGGILADTRVEDRPTLVVSLAYPDCTTAEAAAGNFAERWQDEAVQGGTMADIAPGTVSTHAVSGQGGCAATVVIGADGSDGHPPPFDLAVTAILRREFAPLQIARP